MLWYQCTCLKSSYTSPKALMPIVQAYRAFNKLPNEQEQKFIEEFAKEKKLCFELEYYEEDDDWTEEEDDAV